MGTTQAVVVNLPGQDHARTTYTTPPGGHARLVERPRRQPQQHPDPAGAGRPSSGHGDARPAWYDIEAGYDYLYGEYSLDNGADLAARRRPIDGVSQRLGEPALQLPGRRAPSLFRFRYPTDGGGQRGRRVPRRHRRSPPASTSS